MTLNTDKMLQKENNSNEQVESIPIMNDTLASQEQQQSLKRKRTTTIQPRWYNQAYLLFLALRNHPEHSLPRTKLIDAAIELDKKYSVELQLPKVFRGKTPKNSASASLTQNSDRYFVSFKPEGSRSTHFKLSYDPGNVDDAVQEYMKWCTKLVDHDWPFCFGVPKQDELSTKQQDDELSESPSLYHTPVSHPEESMDDLDSNDIENKLLVDPVDSLAEKKLLVDPVDSLAEEKLVVDPVDYMDSVTESVPEQLNCVPDCINETVTDKMDIDHVNNNAMKNNDSLVSKPEEDEEVIEMTEKLDSQVLIEHLSTPTSTPSTPTIELTPTGRPKKQPIPPEPFIALDKLDLSNIPESWHDIVYVAPSKIPGGGNGLYAKRKLPYNTPIGFYFGVPMTEDEFDSLKDRVGRSSEYSIMYRRTVLDATDDQGQPILDQDAPRFCPFHFMNETCSQKTASVAFVEGAVVNQIICWTKKEIEQDEELLVWYGKDVHRYWSEEEEEEANKQKKKSPKEQEKKKKIELKKLQQEELKRYNKNSVIKGNDGFTWIDETSMIQEALLLESKEHEQQK